MTWDPKGILELLQDGNTDVVKARARRRCEQAPDDAEAWFLLGTAYHREDQRDLALDALREARKLAPADPRPASAIGAILGASGDTVAALEVFESALRQHPQQPRLLVNAAIALEALGRDDEALNHYDRALTAFPGMGDALQNRLALNLRLGRLNRARADAEALERLFPSLAVGPYARASCALKAGHLREALAEFTRASALDVDFAEAWAGRAVALAALGQLEASTAALSHALELDAEAVARFALPSLDVARDDGPLLDPRRIYLVAAWERLGVCNWRDRDQFVRTFDALVLDSSGTDSALRDRALLFAANVLGLPATAQLAADVAAHVCQNARHEAAPFAFIRHCPEKLRLGYLSANFREHPGAHAMKLLLQHHDRERFELCGYSLYSDGSERYREIAQAFDHYCEIDGISDAAAAQQVYADGVDILIDSSGYLQHGRAEILAMKPAPLRMSYAGFPGSLGPAICDYRFSDRLASPNPDDGEFSEALVRLPHAHLLCDSPPDTLESVLSRARVGLPAAAFVYACHNNLVKIEPRIFSAWMRILAAVPNAVLWLLDGGEGSSENLRTAALRQGIDAQRLCFSKRVSYLEYRARLRLADVYLDTQQCSGHVTCNDVLAAGVPVMTLCGSSWAGRIGASQASAAGLADLITNSVGDYVAGAIRLAREPAYLAAVAHRLRQRRAPLFDTLARVRDYERGIIAAWSRYLAGQPPANLDIEPN